MSGRMGTGQKVNTFPTGGDELGLVDICYLDTGVDTTHPALQGVLLPGYDFTRNRSGADETSDVSLLSSPIVTGVLPEWVKGDGSGDLSIHGCGGGPVHSGGSRW